MTDGAEAPRWNTGALWGILAVLLTLGTLGGATVVYAATGPLATGEWGFGLLALAIGGVVATLSFLFLAGILYRVDRYRGVPMRRVKLFE